MEAAKGELESQGVDKNDPRLREVLDELERVDGETEMVNESIKERQEELLSMETSGVQLAEGTEVVSQSGAQLIKDMSLDEAQALLRDFFSKLVKQEVGAQKLRVRIKELNAEMQRKDAILKSFMSSGVSTTDGILDTTDQDGSTFKDASVISTLNLELSEIPEERERERASSLNAGPESAESRGVPQSSSSQRHRSLSPPPRSVAASTASSQSSAAGSAVEPENPPSPRSEPKQIAVKRKTIEINPPVPQAAKTDYRDGGAKSFESMLRSSSARRKVSSKVQDEIIPERQIASAAAKRGQVSKLQLISTITGHEDEVLCLAANGNTLITGSKDKSVKIWDMEASKILATLPNHEYHVKAISLTSPQFFSVSKYVSSFLFFPHGQIVGSISMSESVIFAV